MRRTFFKELQQDYDDRQIPRWLTADVRGLVGNVLHLPARDDIDAPLNEQLIVEYYSR
jgi:small subunit ribosomal protein S4